MKNCIVAIVGDLHVNSTVALCPPSFQLDDGGKYVASKQQRWIWNHWVDYWKSIKQYKETHHIYVVLNGELADDLTHRTTQLITKNDADIVDIAVQALAPCIDVADSIFVTRGSEAHSGASGAIDEIIANEIGAVETDFGYSQQLFRATINGVTLHIAHHPGMGHMRMWTRGGDANRLAAQIFMRYAEMRLTPPDLAIFGHNHKPVDSFDNFPTRAIILPSWQLTNAFGHRIGGGWLPVGGAYVILDGDGYTVKKMFKNWPIASWNTTKLNLHMTS